MDKTQIKYENIGIIDIQLYYPSNYVDQGELEQFDKTDKGKYTLGLGQLKMAFAGDNEDINSFCLTCKYLIDITLCLFNRC